jgi:Glycosyl hydrolase family 26
MPRWLPTITPRRAIVIVAALMLATTTSALSASATATRSATRSSLLQLVPPPDGRAYFGFTFRLWETSDPIWGDPRPFSVRIADSITNELGGKRPTWLTVWETWQQPNDRGKPMVGFSQALTDFQEVRTVTGPGGLLYLDWNLNESTAQNGGITVKDIASGALDDYIRSYARAVKAYRQPVLIRLFGGEFNGSWWYGQSARANPKLTPADFVAAWKRVVDIFRREGALNASWAWVPVASLASSADPNVAPYYPGDKYVDWAGADTADLAGPQVLDPLYAFAEEHGKPLFLAEFALRHGGSVLTPPQQRDWLNAMFDYFESHPDIKAINYFNYNSRPDNGDPYDPARLVYLDGGQVNYQANTNDDDSRLLADSGAGFGAAFARRISSSRYLSSIMTARAPEIRAAATLLAPIVRGTTATIRWRGNDVAQTYDLQVRGTKKPWRTLVSRVRARRFTLRGAPGQQLQVRVRARDDIDQPGAWSNMQRIRFRGS